MDFTLFQKEDAFPRFVMEKLAAVPVDYKEKNLEINKATQEGSVHLKAAVVLLLTFKKINGHSEYVFQLIKRSEKVSQGGDISCPGGMLHPREDNLLGSFLKTGLIPSLSVNMSRRAQKTDKENAKLIRLFLSTALREAWEEIGLNPLNAKFLGVLPSQLLTMFARTIFPVVCVVRKQFLYKLSYEVEKILEIPLSFFFHSDNYATLHIKTSAGEHLEPLQFQTPCLVIPDGNGNNDILWGATFKIISNFLSIISDGEVPSSYPSRIISKHLTIKYIFPKG